MNLQFLGATGTVSGSKYLLERGGCGVLIDCGLFQGFKQLRLRNWAPLPVRPSDIHCVVLTHAHIDHSGYLPLLARNGFAGRIYSSKSTLDLCRIMLPDSGRLQEEEAEFANRHGFSRHKPALPLYTEADAQRCLGLFQPVDHGAAIDLGAGLRASLAPAGHLLGAAMGRVESPETSVLFSGDLGRPADALMLPPAPRPAAGYLVLESTYGNRIHPREDPADALADVVRRTVERRGVVVIPSFAVGRAQSVMYHLWKLRREGRIPDVPVYLNSPMASEASRVHAAHPGEHRLAAEVCAQMYRDVRFVRDVSESRALNERRGPMVIIAGSGMATGGRVIHHLEAFLPDEANTVLFTGFQAGGTRGATIAGGADAVKIHGHYVPVRAEVAMIENLSAHADAAEIVDWLKTSDSQPQRTFITHGEPAAADALRLRVSEQMGWDCVVPDYRERHMLI
ncbi:MAG TPA: MBL fold metallo-hydrolase [Burkholderiales bacterium]|nr:MBL fold metallo-hydrolase [Burkholderiales bacterium]